MFRASATFRGRPILCASLALYFACGLAGCQQDMARQPKQRPLSPTDFFGDGRSERALVEGTIARGSIEQEALAIPKDSDAFPLAVTPESLARGRERFDIYCSVCHGKLGDGNGMVAQRGFRHPPTYHSERLRQAPVGHFYDVMTNGFGAMPDYSAQIPPRDRWAIIAYIRALQLSQNAPASELPAEMREKLKTGGAAK